MLMHSSAKTGEKKDLIIKSGAIKVNNFPKKTSLPHPHYDDGKFSENSAVKILLANCRFFFKFNELIIAADCTAAHFLPF